MQSARQLDLTSTEPSAELGGGSRAERAAAAAQALAPRVGLMLPGAVQRALSGAPPRSAIEGIAAHIVRVIDALDAPPPPVGPEGDDGDERVAALHRRLPPVYGASPGIARAITAALLVSAEPPRA